MPSACATGHTTDADLVAACRDGDARAFRALFERHHRRVYRIAWRFSLDGEDAADLTQETFIRAFGGIGTYRGDAAFSTWLYRIAVNVCLNHLRQMPYDDTATTRPPEPTVALSERPDEIAERREMRTQMTAAVRRLPEALRTAFVLVEMEGLSYREVAELLEVRVETVRMRMSRAWSRMKDMLMPYLDGGKDRP